MEFGETRHDLAREQCHAVDRILMAHLARLRSDPSLKAKLPRLEAAVAEGRTSPAVAVDEIAAGLGI